jgi:hypothetical protein
VKQLKIAAIALTASLYAMAADGQIATNGRGKIKFADSVESYSSIAEVLCRE